MIEQPGLGVRIKELREKKGFTQKELAEKCSITERTLQRIENGYVQPRMYTLKGISNALEDDLNPPVYTSGIENKPNETKSTKVLALFILALILPSGFLFFSNLNQGKAEQDYIEKIIANKNHKFIKFINDGDVDKAMVFYREDACIVANGCGRKFIRNYYTEIAENFRFINLTISNVSVSDTIAVEKGNWIVQSLTGEELKGEYISEWKLSGNQWLIANEISQLFPNLVK